MVTPADYFNDQRSHANYKNHYFTDVDILNDIKEQISTVEHIKNISNRERVDQIVINIAKSYTQRNKILMIVDPFLMTYQNVKNNNDTMEFIAADDAAQLCESIACSAERIAAICVKYDKASTYYYKKVRELTSAEGAMMIWDKLNNDPITANVSFNISKKSLPDLICFKTQSTIEQYWIGGRINLMDFID